MKTISIIAAMILSINFSFAQSTVKKENIKVWGNCGMCKSKIEKSAKQAGAKSADWNEDSKILKVSYAADKTSNAKIQQAIAKTGYDTQDLTGDNSAYEKLHGCCQYDRKKDTKEVVKLNNAGNAVSALATASSADAVQEEVVSKKQDDFSGMLAAYYNVKDALVKSNATVAAAGAAELVKAITNTGNAELKEKRDELLKDANAIAQSKDLKVQRAKFATLSAAMVDLAKTVKFSAEPVYQQYCPMQKASWLSNIKAIKNPYYGSAMLTCGSVKATL